MTSEEAHRPAGGETPGDRDAGGGANAGGEGDATRYLEMLLGGGSGTVDWDRLARDERDPTARDAIRALEEIDRVRTAYESAGSGAGGALEALGFDPGATGRDAAEAQRATATRPQWEGRPQPGERFGPLEVRAERERAGAARRFEAVEPSTGREVEVIALDRSALSGEGTRRALRIARASTGLRGPGLRPSRGVIDGPETAGLVLDPAPPESLAGRIRARGALPPSEVAERGAELAAGLESCHRAGLVHGGLRIEGVGIDSAGHAVLPLPAGLLDPDAAGGPEGDERDDVRNLGRVLLAAATGRAEPGGARAPDPAARDALREALPADLASVVEKACEENPARRFAGAWLLEGALRGWLEEGAGARRASRLRRTGTLLLAAAALAAIAALGVWLFGGD